MEQSRLNHPSRLARLAIGLTTVYQRITAGGIRRCRFVPSCSEYFKESLHSMGMWKALFWTGRRILKCHPWHPGGVDPVPTYGK